MYLIGNEVVGVEIGELQDFDVEGLGKFELGIGGNTNDLDIFVILPKHGHAADGHAGVLFAVVKQVDNDTVHVQFLGM